MKTNLRNVLIVSALVLVAGCKKNIGPSSIKLSAATHALQSALPNFQLVSPTCRLTAFDNSSGFNFIIAYDLQNIQPAEIIEVNGATLTAAPFLVNGAPYTFNNVTSPGNNYSEVGGDHIIAIDWVGSGHYDHLLLYTPGSGFVKLLENAGTGIGNWNVIWSSTAGIGGYNLLSPQDKIIAYNTGNGFKQSLICYRPGNGIFWAIENHGPLGGTPNWVAVAQFSNGVGGYDLRSTNDRIIALDDGNDPTAMHICCYRPGNGILWYFNHQAHTTLWSRTFTTNTGFGTNGVFSLSNPGDRIIPYNNGIGTLCQLLLYRPGSGSISGVMVGIAIMNNPPTAGGTEGPGGYFGYPLNQDPAVSGGIVGDKIVALPNSGLSPSPLVLYAAGAELVSILENGPLGYTAVY